MSDSAKIVHVVTGRRTMSQPQPPTAPSRNRPFDKLRREHLLAANANNARLMLDVARQIILHLPAGDVRLSYWYIHAAVLELRFSQSEEAAGRRRAHRRERASRYAQTGIRLAEQYPEPTENCNQRLQGIRVLEALGEDELASEARVRVTNYGRTHSVNLTSLPR